MEGVNGLLSILTLSMWVLCKELRMKIKNQSVRYTFNQIKHEHLSWRNITVTEIRSAPKVWFRRIQVRKESGGAYLFWRCSPGRHHLFKMICPLRDPKPPCCSQDQLWGQSQGRCKLLPTSPSWFVACHWPICNSSYKTNEKLCMPSGYKC